VLALSGLFQLELFMIQTHSKSRQQAEIAFGHTQSQFFARNHAIEELDSVVQAREAKTQRLREARLAKEAEDIAKASAVLIAKRTRKG
jgi:Tfp pilus assembly protein PilN